MIRWWSATGCFFLCCAVLAVAAVSAACWLGVLVLGALARRGALLPYHQAAARVLLAGLALGAIGGLLKGRSK